MKVVDASVVLQWLLQETSASAREVLDAHLNGSEPSVAPELLNYEIANVLATKAKLTPNEASELFAIFLDLRIETYSLGSTNTKPVWNSQAVSGLRFMMRVTLHSHRHCMLRW